MRSITVYFLFVLLCYSCRSSKLTIEDNKAKEVIMKSIITHGGIDTWQKMKTLSYTKDFTLLDASGNIERESKQRHSYILQPSTQITIETKYNNGDKELLHFANDAYQHYKNGVATDRTEIALEKSINTSMYVIGIPFKLLDPGVDLQYMGVEKIDGEKAHLIQASYNPTSHNNHSTPDVWWYYFDTEDHTVIANKVKTSDHWAWIDNLTFDDGGPIRFNKHRKSYRCDSLGNKLYLRAEYFYDNFKVE